MNRSWAESDELAMLAVHRRYREVNESKIKFQVIHPTFSHMNFYGNVLRFTYNVWGVLN